MHNQELCSNVLEHKSGMTGLHLKEDKAVKLKGFIHNHRITKKIIFFVLRQKIDTIQCLVFKENKNFDQYKLIQTESYVEVSGNLETATVKGCSIKDIELHVDTIEIIGKASDLPFSVRDACVDTDRKDIPEIGMSKLLDNRVLHLRTFQCQAIFRIENAFLFFFRQYLHSHNFMEIKTSKLIESSSEGGANLFEVDYFKRKAYLAQSPQLYKQMAILGGFERVYEIGHVYRAEESNINRYLSEFVGLDIEMEIEHNFNELIYFIYDMFVNILDNIYRDYKREIELIRLHNHFEDLKYGPSPRILNFDECVELLAERNILVDGDLNREAEKTLGEIVRQKYDTDFFVIRKYPKKVRAFYTKPLEGELSASFDFIMRGEEILSGAERINDYDELVKSVEECGITKESLNKYLESFKFGVPRHGGCGIGFERVMKSLFDSRDIRYFNMFPRDPQRLSP